MASTRDVIAPPIFAEDASTTIPPTPIAGQSYRDPVAGPASSPGGWPFSQLVNSAEFNQLMFQWSSLLSIMDLKGILGWSDLKDYTEPSIVFGSDGNLYLWVQENGPSQGSGVRDPVSSEPYWQTLQSSLITQSTDGIPGSASRLKASSTGTSAIVSVTADAICLKNASGQQVVVSALSLSINSAAVGVNGLDSGTLAASTWYYVWAIYNPTTGTASGILSLSDNAPSLPSGYTHAALVSAVRTDATVNKYPIRFGQIGDDWFYAPAAGSNLTTQAPIAASGAAGNVNTPTYVAVAIGAFVPARAVAVDARAFCITPLANVLVAPSTAYTTQSSPPIRIAVGGTAGNAAFSVSNRLLLESTNIYWASNDSTAALHIDGFKLGL